MHPIVPIIQEHRRISKQLSLLQNLIEMVCLMDPQANAVAQACASMLSGVCECVCVQMKSVLVQCSQKL